MLWSVWGFGAFGSASCRPCVAVLCLDWFLCLCFGVFRIRDLEFLGFASYRCLEPYYDCYFHVLECLEFWSVRDLPLASA